jgi:hypothetical protein
LLGDGWAIGAGSNERRVCRFVAASANAIDANIAAAGEDVDVGAALLGRNLLLVRGSETPSDRTTHRAVPAFSETTTNTNR